MYIVRHEEKDLVGKKVTPANIITNEIISFQVIGTGAIKLETSIDGVTWYENKYIKDVVAPCYVEVSDCIIGNFIHLTTDGEFKSVIINL